MISKGFACVKPGEKFLLTEKLPMGTTIDESMISGEPIG
jgi:hypothetical protein